jgi:rubrerythrin
MPGADSGTPADGGHDRDQADPPDGGGDPACWVSRVCPECGRLDDGPPPARCPGCGAALTAD